MAALSNVPQIAVLILVVIVVFNLIIFVHELGHYWAAKWRGLKIDRFQIWFGKPIWSKNIDGVQWGLGWIPFGGFVALPQMAPMESIEGGNLDREPLPPIKPLDKIIVAFAGPLFSFLLALAAAIGVSAWGKPKDFAPTQEVAEIDPGSPAEKAGFKPGDWITHINGREVQGWDGRLDSIFMQIVTSEGEQIEFTVRRPGEPEPVKLVSTFETGDSKWYQRRALRRVGIGPKSEWVMVSSVIDGSPAALAGLRRGDRLVSLGGAAINDPDAAIAAIKASGEKPLQIEFHRGDLKMTKTIQPVVPVEPEGKGPMIGAGFAPAPAYETAIIKPGPIQQITDTLEMMWVTISRVVSPKSSIGIDHLSGPVGIATIKYEMLLRDHPWQRLLAFMVLLNINLAILNMLPLPVLDGGHITLAVLEKLKGRPVRAKVLEYVQVGFAMLLFSVMIYVTSKDIGDKFGRGNGEKIVFPAN